MFFKKSKPPRAGERRHPDFPELSEIGYRTVLSALLKRRGVDRYLEIGSRTGDSIAHVECSYAAVDPEFCIEADVFNDAAQMLFFQQTSDDFFASCVLPKMEWVPDLCFIDGMHLFEFALRDFMNSEAIMGPEGVICLHDVCPFDYEMSVRDPDALERPVGWTGDVWKVVMALLDLRPDLTVDVVAAHKTGLACVSGLDPNSTVLRENYDKLIEKYSAVYLGDIGAEAYYSRFDLVDPDDYIARIGRG